MWIHRFFKFVLRGVLVPLTFLLAGVSLANAAELVMFEQNGCVWCQRWHEEIGVIYNKTSEGAIAPLRTVNIHQDIPDDLKHIKVERFTPTFVVLNDGAEVGRLRGYSGDEFFWFLLGEILDKIPHEAEESD